MSLMPNVKIAKNELLEKLKNNLEQHKIDIDEALDLRRENIEDKLSRVVIEISNNPEYQPDSTFNFPKPTNNSRDYEKAIKMVEMTQDQVIELSEDQFDKLVLDNWYWKNELINTSALYGKLM